MLISQAKEWESSGEHARAVDCYLKVTDKVTTDTSILAKSWIKAAEIALKFLTQEKSSQVRF